MERLLTKALLEMDGDLQGAPWIVSRGVFESFVEDDGSKPGVFVVFFGGFW